MFDRNVFVEVYNDGTQPLPAYAHVGDAGCDVYANEGFSIYPNETKMVKTGLYVAIPQGYEIQVRPRSGMSAKTKIRVSNSPGTIDAGYRGQICVLIDNIGDDPYKIIAGDRVAQLVIAPVWNITWRSVDSKEALESTPRGEGGFGSTGG